MPNAIVGYTPVFEDDNGDLLVDPDDVQALAGEGDESGARRYRPRKVERLQRRSGRKTARAERLEERAEKFMGAPSGAVRVKSGILGLGTVTVAQSGTGTIDAVAQEPIYLQRLLLDGDTAYFVLSDVKVGAKSIYSGVEPVPAGMFRPDATGAPFSLKIRMRVGQTVSVFVTNTDAGNSRSIQGAFKTIEQA